MRKWVELENLKAIIKGIEDSAVEESKLRGASHYTICRSCIYLARFADNKVRCTKYENAGKSAFIEIDDPDKHFCSDGEKRPGHWSDLDILLAKALLNAGMQRIKKCNRYVAVMPKDGSNLAQQELWFRCFDRLEVGETLMLEDIFDKERQNED